ncbi:hypothetical protein MATL_G00257610 [Megalops atlanticus]|uniref:Uncharacterized protein n=1 Tax=Megalops atlanticus TaxID=7932 RepID=A0A9D3PEN8_MEGAT|nr:hypothetical protein MATL_G00257610 [Megalops atlanticus]
MVHLVEFLVNKTVAVVPRNWYTDGVTHWPKYRSDERVERAVKGREEPGPDWDTYDVRIIKSCENYLEARQLLKKSLTCNTSDLQSDEEEEVIRVKRKPKPVHFYGGSDIDSDKEEKSAKKRGRIPKSLPSGPAAPHIPPPPSIVPPPPSTTSPQPTECFGEDCLAPTIPLTPFHAPPPPGTPPLTPLQLRRTEYPSKSQGYRPTWRGQETIACSAAEVQILSLLQYLKHQQDQLIAKVNYLTSKLSPAVETHTSAS